MATQCVVISGRPEDQEFCKKIAKRDDLDFHIFMDAKSLNEFLVDYPTSIIFWDVDHKHAETPGHPISHRAVSSVLAQRATQEKVFALSDSPLNEVPHLKGASPFGHYFLRYLNDPTTDIAARVIQAAIATDPFDLPFYVPEGVVTQKIQIKESAHKRAAAAALNNIFLKLGLPSRLATAATQSIDELMMNAIFDAPRSVEQLGKKGTYEIAHRSNLQRGENFVLEPSEAVSLEFAVAPGYIAVCVGDQFGSIRKEDVVPFLKRDYSVTGYNPRAGAAGALGINGIVGLGVSLLFLCRPGFRTQAIVFLPVIDNFKAFRTSFRFFSFLSK